MPQTGRLGDGGGKRTPFDVWYREAAARSRRKLPHVHPTSQACGKCGGGMGDTGAALRGGLSATSKGTSWPLHLISLSIKCAVISERI